MTHLAAYRFCGLSVGYGKSDVLSSLSGTIFSGTVTALIGPNGGGKSTLLAALAGFLPYRGSLLFREREVRKFSRRELGRAVGFAAQNTGVRAGFCVRDVIALGLLPRRALLSPSLPEDDRIVLDAARRLEVDHLLLRPVTELSGGERQRALLAMLLAQDPEVFLLDEPTSAMDPRQSLAAFALMRELSARGKTVVAAAHDVNAALARADFFIALRGGHVIASGAVGGIDGRVLGELYGAPFVPYTSSGGDRVWFPASDRR